MSTNCCNKNIKFCCCMDYQSRLLLFAIFNLVITGIQLMLPLITTGMMVILSVSDGNQDAVYMLNQQTMRIIHKPPTITNTTAPIDDNTLKSDIHIWAGWLLLHVILFCYAWTLYFGIRSMCYKRCLSWLSLNAPMTSLYVMMLIMDLAMKTMSHKNLKDQIIQYLQASYGIFGVSLVYFFLGKIERGTRKQTYRDMSHFDSPVKFQEMSEKE